MHIKKSAPKSEVGIYIYKKKDLKRKGKKIRFRPRNKVKIQEKKILNCNVSKNLNIT